MSAVPDAGVMDESLRTGLRDCTDLYFSAIVFTMWDNVYGPRVIRIWQSGKPGAAHVPYETLRAVASYALTGEASRHGKMIRVEPKFFCFSDKDIIVNAFLFTVEHEDKRCDLFSMLFVLPYAELTHWMSRYFVLNEKAKEILEHNLIPRLRHLYKQPNFVPAPRKFDAPLQEFVSCPEHCERSSDIILHSMNLVDIRDLIDFIELVYSIRNYCIPNPFMHPLEPNHFYSKKDHEDVEFLQRAITSHLQTSCRTVVLGRDKESVNTMIRTLSFFMSDNERALSRMMSDESYTFNYIRHLCVQGFIYKGSGPLPFKVVISRAASITATFIDLNSKEVRQVLEPGLPYMNTPYWDKQSTTPEVEMSSTRNYAQLNDFSVKRDCSPFVQNFLAMLYKLPADNGSRHGYLSQFVRWLHRKMYSLLQYVEAEEQDTANLGESPVECKVDCAKLLQDLDLHTEDDLRLILGMAAKVDPRVVAKVMVDRTLPTAEFIKELQTV